jgi:hypothetical protein
MDANPVASSHDAFDALLDASSLGAPRVQAVRRLTPAAVHDLLDSRLTRRSLPAADTTAQPAPLPEQVAEGAQPPLPRAREEQEPQHAPDGSGSHHCMQIKSNSETGKGIAFQSHSIPYERILGELNCLTQDFADLTERILAHVFLDSFLSCPTEALKAAEVPMETRLLKQLFFPEQDSNRIGRYGMGAKLALASPLIREELWRSGTPTADLLDNERFGHTDGNQRVRAGRPRGYGRNVPDEVWRLRDTDAAQRVAAAVCSAVLPSGPGHWLVLWPYASDPSARGMSTQTGQGRAWATSHLLGTVTAQRTQRRDPWWPEEIDADAGLHDWLAESWLSGRGSQGNGRSFGRQRSNSGNDRRAWLDCSFAVYGPGAPARSHAVPQTAWQLVYGLLGRLAPGPHGFLTAHKHWPGMRASLEERPTPGATGAAANRVHGFSERCPAHQYWPLGRVTVSMHPRPDDRMPALAPEFVMATRTAELLRTSLSWTCREQAPLQLALALELLLPAGGSAGVTSRACRIEATQEATTARETARLILLAGNCRIAIPAVLTNHCGDLYAVPAVSEGPSREPTVWTFARDLRVAGMQQGSSGHGNARAGTADRQSGDQVDTCMDIRVNTAEGEAVLQLKRADLVRLLDSTQENIDSQNELHRMPSVDDTVSKEWLSDAHRH